MDLQTTKERRLLVEGSFGFKPTFRPRYIYTGYGDHIFITDRFNTADPRDRRNVLRQEKLINDTLVRFPDGAEENMEILNDNGTVGLVNKRVFMTIRERYFRKGRENLESLMLEHKDALMKKEAEWLTKMENEKIELGKQISIRDQMVLEARAETNEYKSMNQSILSQISDKEAKIAQVSFNSLGLGINPSPEFEPQTKK